MDFPHPPFVSSATTQPRQLQRWLDINPQGGPLGRTQTYITLPTFNVAVTWRGYSDIVASFNFEGPNNFSLKSLSNIPASPNYLLAISWRDSSGNVKRYALWSGVGEVIYFNLPLYVGQMIKKNFRLEVWSTNVANCSQAVAINFYTSVLGILDYRWGNDLPLVGNDGLVTNFEETKYVAMLPNNVNNGLTQHFLSTNGFAGITWSSLTDVTTISSAGAVNTNVNNLQNIFTTINTNGVGLTGAIGGGATPVINFVGIVFYPVQGGTGILAKYDNSLPITVSDAGLTVNGVTLAYPFGFNRLYFAFIQFQSGVVIIYDVYTQQSVFVNVGASVPTASTTLQILDASNTYGVLEMFSYFNVATLQSLYNYITATYSPFLLPLTFPANSVSAPN